MKFMLEYMQVQLISSLIHNDFLCFRSQIIWATSCEKGPDDIFLSIFSFKLFSPLHSPNNMMKVIKVQK